VAKKRRQRQALRLGFRQLECRCGEVRIYGQRCDRCGRSPAAHEIDHNLARRRRLVELARCRTADERGVTSVASVEEFLDRATDLLTSLLPTANSALQNNEPESADKFADVASALANLGDDVVALTALRPARALRPALVRLADALAGVVAAVLGALESGGLREAQRHGDRVQPLIDEAAASAGEARGIYELWSLGQAEENPLVTCARLAARHARPDGPLEGILDLAGAGQAWIAARLPGTRVSGATGANVAVLAAVADLYFDSDQFWATVAWQSKLITSQRDAFRTLANDDRWQTEMVRAAELAVDAGFRIGVLSAAATHDRQSAHAVLDLCHDMQEGIGKALIATSRYVWKDNVAFPELLASGVGNLAEWLDSKGVAAASAFSIPSRNAKAHNDWRLEGDAIVLCELRPPDGGPVRLSFDELANHLLEIGQTALALYLGTSLGADALSIEMPVDEQLLAPSWENYCGAILLAGGWSDADVRMGSGIASVSGEADRAVSIVELATLLPYLPSAVNAIDVRVRTPLGQRRAYVTVEPLRQRTNTEVESSRSILFSEFLRRSSIEGRPVIDEAQWRKCVVAAVAPWLVEQSDEHGVSAAFSVAKSSAKACNDELLWKVLRRAQGWRNDRLSGFRRPVEDLEPFYEWMGTRVPELEQHM
jgi:hypothetical protein